MSSDWRLVPAPLRRRACTACGLVAEVPDGAAADVFVRGYSLYAHAPTDARDRQRQELYAAWIHAAVEPRTPRHVLDVGCGNGSLLHALLGHWPHAVRMGCDLSVDSVRHGLEAGLKLWPLAPEDLPSDVRADVVLSVNVIEHTADPLAFLSSVRQRVAAGGLLVLVCPDGATADVELLIKDHAFSFTRQHLEHLLANASFDIRGWTAAPERLGAFQMVVAEPSPSRLAMPPLDSQSAVVASKASYLRRWAALDGVLSSRVGHRPVTCFGMGEAAGLLRAYAPGLWGLVAACTADQPTGGQFGAVAVVALSDAPPDRPVLVAVHPRDQERVAATLRQRFATVVTWYDLLTADAPRR
jgi:SAM-dependent methyltransferase